MKQWTQKIAILSLLAICACSGAYAKDDSEAGWKWRLSPLYLWAIQLEGDASIGPITAPINIKLSDVFGDLEGVFTANFEGVKDRRWGFLMDFTWLDISSSQGPLTVDFEYIQAEVDGFYRVPIGRQNVDWLIGLRYYSQDFGIGGLPSPPLPSSSASTSEDWVDPLIGARWSTPLDKRERWTLALRGDIGGFGVGSDFAWQALAVIDFQPWKHVSIDGGFRALGVDYEEGSGVDRFAYDATTWGPVLGFSLKW